MSTTVRHACIELLPVIQAGALGHEIEQRFHGKSDWSVKTDGSFVDSFEYRVKKKVRIINGIEVPAPASVSPRVGDKYYVIALSCPDGVLELTWEDTEMDNTRYLCDQCFLSREDAQANLKVIYEFVARGLIG